MSKPIFTGRKKARRYALQALYGWLLSGNDLADIEAHTLLEHGDDAFDREYFQSLLHDVPSNLGDIEQTFAPHLSRKLQELDPIELTILRIATYELMFRQDIPYRVVINEALELAKGFGATESYKFVNGVLDKLARVLRSNEIG
jgi:transcription antitermination protein NusB